MLIELIEGPLDGTVLEMDHVPGFISAPPPWHADGVYLPSNEPAPYARGVGSPAMYGWYPSMLDPESLEGCWS